MSALLPELLASEIKQTCLSTSLAVYWLLSSEQPDPTYSFNNNTRTHSSRTRGRSQLPWLQSQFFSLGKELKKKDIKCTGIKFWGCLSQLKVSPSWGLEYVSQSVFPIGILAPAGWGLRGPVEWGEAQSPVRMEPGAESPGERWAQKADWRSLQPFVEIWKWVELNGKCLPGHQSSS